MNTDRDRSIEGLLHRTLASEDQTGPDCLDAETLAAFADRGLSAAERRTAETHVADCRRCQAVLAAIVREPLASPALAPEVTGPWWKGRGALNWLIPAMAGATAIALWVAVPGQRDAALDQAERQSQATAEPSRSAVAVPSEPSAAPAQPSAAPVEPLAKPSTSAPEEAQARAGADEGAREDAQLQAPTSADVAESDRRATAREEAARDRLSDAGAGASAPLAEAVGSQAAVRAAAAPFAASFEVASSDTRSRWRVGPGATVQHSEDGGATWGPQETGGAGPWTAGSAPSSLVCWLVGPRGTVLRTADGGRTWQPAAFPETSADLVDVRAVDALSATITLADGRRFSTSDGGLTWVRMP